MTLYHVWKKKVWGAKDDIWFIERNNNSIINIDEDSEDEEDEDCVDDESSTDSISYTSEHNNTPAHTYPTHHSIVGVMDDENDDNGDDNQDNDATHEENTSVS